MSRASGQARHWLSHIRTLVLLTLQIVQLRDGHRQQRQSCRHLARGCPTLDQRLDIVVEAQVRLVLVACEVSSP